ncbi:MAG: carboxylesterase family protein [Solobacterium sp.]|nr:carboxylesterase family protein [Solobacterium sp.]
MLYWIIFTVLSLLFGVFLELNHNTLAGWGMFIIWIIAFVLFHKNRLAGSAWYVKGIALLGYGAVFALIVYLTWPPVKAVPAVDVKDPDVTGVIHTGNGDITGVYNADHTVEVYAGIPYAAPPVGDLRFRKPQDPESWEGVRACDTFAPMSMQAVNPPFIGSLARIIGYHDYKVSLKDNYREPVSEDSLYLNIWKPAGEVKDLPVLVYIHGGSLQTGQPWYADYSGEGFAKDGVITVNMGYRLGVFGFYADDEVLEEEGTAGCWGLLDQIKALEWVRDNIAAFGGDPANVTLAGESAGAVCVDALCVSPLAEGLFDRAVLESSTASAPDVPHSWRSLENALASGKDLKQRYGCQTADDLRKLDAETIVNEMNTQHHITADGCVLPDDPYVRRKQGIHNEKAILHGFNTEESGPFILFSKADMKNFEQKIRGAFGEYADDVLKLYPVTSDQEAAEAWAEIYGVLFFNYSHYCLNRLAAGNGIPVYEYLFAKTNRRLSCWHSGELVYAFGMIPEDSKLYDDSDRELSATMHRYWVNFAKTGDPNGEGLPVFEENTDSRRMMLFGNRTEMTDEPYMDLYAILDRMHGYGK